MAEDIIRIADESPSNRLDIGNLPSEDNRQDKLEFRFVRNSGAKSCILELACREGINYLFNGAPIEHKLFLRMNRSDLSVFFQQGTDPLAYSSTFRLFSSFMGQYASERGNPVIVDYKPYRK